MDTFSCTRIDCVTIKLTLVENKISAVNYTYSHTQRLINQNVRNKQSKEKARGEATSSGYVPLDTHTTQSSFVFVHMKLPRHSLDNQYLIDRSHKAVDSPQLLGLL